MRITTVVVGILLGCTSGALAQGAAGSSSGASGASVQTGAGRPGATLSNGNTLSGTGGSPGPNTSDALNHGTTGNSFGATRTDPGAGSSAGNAVTTPAAKAAEQSLESTDTGILRK